MAFLCILRPCQKWGDDANRPVIISTIHHVEAAVYSVIQKCTLLLYHISVLQIARVETEIAKSYVVRTLETILIYRGSSNLRGFHYCISHLCDFWLMYTANVYRTIIGQLSENAL